jgi:hypothetical protein
MNARRAFAAIAVVAACGGRVAASDDEASTGDATTSGGSSDTSTGEPEVCTPVGEAAIEAQHRRGDAGMPSAGESAHVDGGRDGAIVAAITDLDEDDDDVLVTSFGASDDVQWSVRYEGMAGLQDAALDVVTDGDGEVYALVREQVAELVSEGFGTRNRYVLVVLAIGPGGERRWRYARSNDPGGDEDVRAGALAIDGDGHVIVVDANTSGGESGPPTFTRLDRYGNTLAHVDVVADVGDVLGIAIAPSPTGEVVVAASPYAGRWIARLGVDGSLRWEHRDEVGDEYVSAIAVDADDVAWTLLSVGDVEAGTAGFALQRLDADGVALPVIEHAFDGGSGYAGGLVVDCDGTALVAAETGFAPDRRAELFAVARDGSVAWSTMLESSRPLAPRSIAALGDGSLAIGGLDGEELGPWVARLAG